MATLQQSGMIPVFKLRLTIWVKGDINDGKICLKTFRGILSLVDLSDGIALMNSRISDSEISSKLIRFATFSSAEGSLS